MKNVFFAFLVFFGLYSNAQLSVKEATNQNEINKLVRDFVGRGVPVRNIQYKGYFQSMGGFTENSSTLGINKGIILTNGLAKYAEGPNDTITKGFRTNVSNSEETEFLSYLDAINNSIGNLKDINSLEFEFYPNKDTLIFSIVYGSEEYSAQVTQNSDPFVALLSGAGIADKVNVAKLPGVDFIGTLKINNGEEANWRIPPSGPCKNCELFVYNPPNNATTQYNGYTKVLTFKYAIQKCNWYKLKFMIADEVGNFEDSGVLISSANFKENKIDNPNDLENVNYCSNEIIPPLKADSLPNASFQWFYNNTFNNNTTSIQTLTVSGIYKVVSTFDGSCFWEDTIRVKIGQNFEIKPLFPSQLICSPDTIAMSFSTLPTQSNTQKKWLDNDNNLLSDTTFLKIFPNIDSLSIKVDNNEGCVKDTSIYLKINKILFKSKLATDTTKLCLGDSIEAKIDISFYSSKNLPQDSLSKKWFINESLLDSLSQKTKIKIPIIQDSEIKVLVKNGLCAITDSVQIETDSAKAFDFPNSISGCINDKKSFSVDNDFDAKWLINNNLFSTNKNYDLIFNTTISTLGLMLTDQSNQCKRAFSSPIINFTLPNYNFINDTLICKNQIFSIAILDEDISWNLNSEKSLSLVPTKDTTLRFEISNKFNCKKRDSIFIKSAPLPTITIAGKNFICNDKKLLVLTASGANNYRWLNNNSLARINTLNNINGEKITVIGSNLNNCLDTAFYSYEVKALNRPFLISATGTTFCKKDNQYPTLYAPSDLKFVWQPYNVSFNGLNISKEGKVYLLAFDSDNCSQKDSITIIKKCVVVIDTTPQPEPDTIKIIPNIITPNGDGKNDKWVLKNIVQPIDVKIYNRYGTLIFSSSNYGNDWGDENLEDGFYYFYFESEKKKYKGTVMVVR